MNIENLLPLKRRKPRTETAATSELPKDMLQLLGKSTGDEMLNSFLKNTSIAPLSIYNRLRQFGEFYQDNLWNITAREASDVLEAFGRVYDLIVEEDNRTSKTPARDTVRSTAQGAWLSAATNSTQPCGRHGKQSGTMGQRKKREKGLRLQEQPNRNLNQSEVFLECVGPLLGDS